MRNNEGYSPIYHGLTRCTRIDQCPTVYNGQQPVVYGNVHG